MPPAGPEAVGAVIGPVLIAVVIAGLILVLPQSSFADTGDSAKTPDSILEPITQPTTQSATGSDGLEGLSDTQLTRLAADWGTLDDVERTELIQETRQRMQPQRPTERRRYGRLVRQPDGTVVRSVVEIQTRVRVQGGDRRQAFGMGFERRHTDQSSGQYKTQPQRPKAAASNSVISVSDTPKPSVAPKR